MKAAIHYNPAWMRYEVYLYDELPNGQRRVIQPVELIAMEVPQGTPAEPTFILDRWNGEAFFKAFADAMAEKGYKTENQHRIDGELEATKRHLEDMRKLAMQPKVILTDARRAPVAADKLEVSDGGW